MGKDLTRREKRRYLWLTLALAIGAGLAITVVVNSAYQYERVAEIQARVGANGPGAALAGRMYRNLAVNTAAAIALLGCIGFVAARFRYHLRAKRWEQQLALARAVQSQLIPAGRNSSPRLFSSPSGRREPAAADGDAPCALEIASEWVPLEEVGGDLFDVFPIGEEERDSRVAFALGDVSGKGLPAALLMALIHGAVRSNPWHAGRYEHEDFARRLNELLCGRTAGARFASLFWGQYDPDAATLRYISAGHCPGFLLRAGEREPVRLESSGPVLGLLGMSRYTQMEAAFAPGDVLVLYSDGVVEAANREGEEFGEGRLREALKGVRGASAEQVRAAIMRAYWSFLGTSQTNDDLTLLVLEARQTAGLGRRAPGDAGDRFRLCPEYPSLDDARSPDEEHSPVHQAVA